MKKNTSRAYALMLYMTDDLKQCIKCKEWKPRTEYHICRAWGVPRIRSWCKTCRNVHHHKRKRTIKSIGEKKWKELVKRRGKARGSPRQRKKSPLISNKTQNALTEGDVYEDYSYQ